MKREKTWLRGVAAGTLFVFITTSCGGKTPVQTTGSGGQMGSASPLVDHALVQLKDAPPGLDLRISEGKAGAPGFDHAKLPPAKKLTAPEAEALLARLRPIAVDKDDQQAFALRPGSQPVPRTGDTVKGQFPPAPSSLLPPAANDAGKDLKVLRYMPEGQVPLAPELSVTFSQPMVAVTGQADAAATVPVRLSPQPKGKWRWIGTRTVLFDPEIRFPQATTYTVEIPAGTKSANGGALKAATKFTFETPAPTLKSWYPSSNAPQKLDVPMLLAFDQKIDPQAVLAGLKLSTNNTPIAVTMMSAAEIAKDKTLNSVVEGLDKDEQQGRYLAFHAARELPVDSTISIEIPVGTPSAEGPNKTVKAQTHTFRTYSPLRITHDECGYQGNCPPGTPFVIQFNNPLDTDKFADAQLSISPDIPGLKIVQSYSSISIMGATKPRTTYKVVVSGGLLDEFGQTLAKDSTLTWKVTDAVPTFYGPNGLVVLDPAAKKPTLDFFTTNYEQLKVKLYAVDTSDYDGYGFAYRNQWNRDKPPRIPGRKVFDQLVKTPAGKNLLAETHIDLGLALAKTGLGHAIAIVEPYPWKESYEPPRLLSWVQSTKLAVDAFVDHDQLVAFATDLQTGKPLSGVALEIRPFGIKGTTNDQGMATLALGKGGVKGAHYLVAKKGDDVAFVTEDNGYWNEFGSWVKQERPTQLAWYVIDDRKMYKPGEDITLKGWLRTVSYGKGGDIGGMSGAVNSIEYKVRDSQGNEIGKGSMAVSAVGGFDTKITLPKTPNLGYAYATLEAKGRMTGTYTHSFRIEEFRRPEFSVAAQASQGPFLIGGSGDVTVNASYFAGGPLGGAPVQWYVTASASSFTPPNRDEFTFGTWSPWWGGRGFDDEDGEGYYGRGYKPPKTWSLAGKTDAAGTHIAHFDFLSSNPPVPMSVTANASVTDVNRQTWSASSALLVHPSSLYVGLRTKKPFVEKGQPFEIDTIGVDLEGKSVPGAKIEVKSVRLDWKVEKGRYKQVEVDPQACAVTVAKDPVPCSFATKEGGTYKVTAMIVDDKGRPNQTTLEFWVTGGDEPPSRDVAMESVKLVPDKKEYAPGNTAELLLQAPFYPAEGIVSWRRNGIIKTDRIAITGPSKVITVPINDGMTPNMFVQVDLVGMASRLDDHGVPDLKLPKRPAYASGSIDLPVPPKHRTLGVTVTNIAKASPGTKTKVNVIVKDAQGRPVPNAEAAVLVVDEAVLSLSGYQFPNPINVFYGHREADTRSFYLRGYVKLAKPEGAMVADRDGDGILDSEDNDESTVTKSGGERDRRVSANARGPARKLAEGKMGKKKPKEEKEKGKEDRNGPDDEDGEPDADPSKPIAIRANFNPLAAFAPAVHTDGNGAATVDLTLPDNLTRYRVVAIATAGDKQFGKGESTLTARLPLMVRPSPPRFLNFGDTFELPVVVQNQTDSPMTVKVAVRAANASIVDGAGREIAVPANDRVEVRFPAAAQLAGTARFQIAGSNGTDSDASELALPVWTPATTEAFATYGVIDDGAVKQPVALPGKVVTQFGGIEVTTASTNLQALTDALLYLVKYPYECAEQRASRILAVAALKDVLTAFKTKDLPSPAVLEASVKADIERLSQMQNSDGGYAFWERGRPSEPYLSVFVTNALQHARAKGFAVPQEMIDRGKSYLRDVEKYYPWYYGKDIRFSISSFALYTRKQLGDVDVAKAKKVLADFGGIKADTPLEGLGWWLGAMAGNTQVATERKAIVRHVMNKVSETAGAANFTTSYGDGNYLMLGSDRRVDAVLLESLIQEQKDLDLIPKVVTGLLAHRKAGRWLNTQENTFALTAMDLYFRTYEKTTPDFVARVWLGNDYAGDHAFKGRTTEYFAIPIPMKDVASHDKQAVTIQKDGKGRLYYRLGMTYAPASLKLDPADYGFVVTRTYEPIDNPKDVSRTADGTWHVKAGARVRVKLNMVNENRRYHVALVDPMPAGFEAMNPALAVTGPIPTDPNQQKAKGAYWWWYGPWYEHQNMRDERVEAFASLLWEGVHTYEYVARATTPGNFVVPPPKAEEMYMPETFGRGGSDRVVVE